MCEALKTMKVVSASRVGLLQFTTTLTNVSWRHRYEFVPENLYLTDFYIGSPAEVFRMRPALSFAASEALS